MDTPNIVTPTTTAVKKFPFNIKLPQNKTGSLFMDNKSRYYLVLQKENNSAGKLSNVPSLIRVQGQKSDQSNYLGGEVVINNKPEEKHLAPELEWDESEDIDENTIDKDYDPCRRQVKIEQNIDGHADTLAENTQETYNPGNPYEYHEMHQIDRFSPLNLKTLLEQSNHPLNQSTEAAISSRKKLSPVKKQKCHICHAEVFRLSRHLLTHVNKCQPTNVNKPLQIYRQVYICKQCPSLEFKSKRDRDAHVKTHILEKLPLNQIQQQYYQKKSIRFIKPFGNNFNCKWKCLICLEVFDNLNVSDFTSHEMKHEEFRQQKCVHCDQLFDGLNTLWKHMSIHRSMYQCNICGQKYVMKHNLINHERKVHMINRIPENNSAGNELYPTFKMLSQGSQELQYKY